MFDGNHRSKRSINLSKATRRNRSAASSRSAILQKSKEQREKRLRETRRLQAATLLQKNYRGYRLRFCLVETLAGADTGVQVGNKIVSGLREGLPTVERFSGLFLNNLNPLTNEKKHLLLRFARESESQLRSRQQTLAIEDERFIFYRRVVLQTLIVLQIDDATSMEEKQLLLNLVSSIFFSASPPLLNKIIGSHDNERNMSQIEMELIACIKKQLWGSTSTANTDTTNQIMQAHENVVSIMDLLKMSNLISQIQPNSKFRGYCSALILGSNIDRTRMFYAQMQSQSNMHIAGNELEWFISLFETLYNTMFPNGNKDSAAEASLPEIVTGREVVVLNNALEIMSKLDAMRRVEKSASLQFLVIKIMEKIFDPMSYANDDDKRNEGPSMQARSLVILSGLAAKGVNLETLLKEPIRNDIIDLTANSDDEDEEDANETEDEERLDTDHITTSSVVNSRTNRPSGRNMRRQDFQTTNKLNQSYKVKLNEAQRDVTNWMQGGGFSTDEFLVKSLCNVAQGIGSGAIIVQLISTAFQKNDNAQNHIRRTLCTILCMVLQNCTGCKARDSAMSPLLSKLAFNPTFMENLWAHVLHQLRCLSVSPSKEKGDHREQDIMNISSAVTCFCDLFSHQLLALDDEDFLMAFTDMNPNGKAKSRILAVDVIVHIKQMLHEVYWSKPATTADFFVPSSPTMGSLEFDEIQKYHKARLMLSGTKLWNSIYTRWSRLYRTNKFCEEELWFFPHLSTRVQDEKGAVDPSTADSDNNMQEDDDSIDSRMDVDEDLNAEAGAADDSLASSFKDPKMARILTSIPQALPFGRRAKLFSSLLSADIVKTQDETAAMHAMMMNMQRGIEGAEFTGRERVKIRRDKLYSDSMSQLNRMGSRLKKRVQVTFISQHGNEEAGVDGGGLFKEFLDDLIKNAFDPTDTHERDALDGPLFVESPLQTLAVNTKMKVSSQMLSHYQFLGRVLGKAVYESILVEPQFCLPLLNQLLGQHNTIDDLKNLDPVYYKHLHSLRNMSGEEIESLDLAFEVSAPSDGTSSSSHTVELIPGGSSIRVTKDNAVRYVHLVAHRRLNIDTSAQINAMRSGFRDLIPASWVRLFSPYELQKVISGDDLIKGFDVNGLKSVMEYGGGFHPSQPIMLWFWEVIEEMTSVQKCKFLKFVTSCSRQPLLGFRVLSPLPCIHQVRLNEDNGFLDKKKMKLPTSATCMNLLKLPNYMSKEILREKLLYAIESGAGFELS